MLLYSAKEFNVLFGKDSCKIFKGTINEISTTEWRKQVIQEREIVCTYFVVLPLPAGDLFVALTVRWYTKRARQIYSKVRNEIQYVNVYVDCWEYFAAQQKFIKKGLKRLN